MSAPVAVAVALVAALAGGCAGRPGRPPVAGRPPPTSFAADLRLTSFGPEGRLRSRGYLVVAAPDRLRVDVYGPHGGVLAAVACDGRTLTALDGRDGQITSAPATAEAFDALWPLVPLHLDARGWVALLRGCPGEETAAAPAPAPAPAPASGPAARLVATRAADGTLVSLRLVARDGATLALAEPTGGGPLGLPVAWRLEAPARGVSATVRLEGVAAGEPPAGAFTLAPPAANSR